MFERLPPLSSLRAFEAVARHASFTRAARELHVTQSAVSHQIRGLEDYWGIALFKRSRRSVVLTESGSALAPVVRDGLSRISEAVQRLREEQEGGALRVSLLQSFAVRWLLPRLPEFTARHPAVQVWLSTTSEAVDFARDDADVAIRLGRGGGKGLHSTPLFLEKAFPVCNPAYRDAMGVLHGPRDLLEQPVIQVIAEARGLGWTDWFAAAGLPGAEPGGGPRFSDSGLAMQAALDGQGIALGRVALALDDLIAGRLVRLFDIDCSSDAAYHLVCPEGQQQKRKIVAFRSWLVERAGETQSAYRRLTATG